MSKATVALRLDEETQRRLKALGQTRDRSPHYLMKQAVEKFLAVEEEIEREKVLTKSRWERFELTGESVEHGEVRRWLNTLSNESNSSGISDGG